MKVDQVSAIQAADPFLYAGDNYPRSGCRLRIDINADGYLLFVFDPTGRPLEAYSPARSATAIGRMVREWCEGRVPKSRAGGD